jgi:hypothetical protein
MEAAYVGEAVTAAQQTIPIVRRAAENTSLVFIVYFRDED